jgi:hypothetical protein
MTPAGDQTPWCCIDKRSRETDSLTFSAFQREAPAGITPMNTRTFTAMCSRVICGITTCSREPSGSIASTNGVERVDAVKVPEQLGAMVGRSM